MGRANYIRALFFVGLIGCIKNIQIDREPLDPRYIVRTNRMVGEVSIDNCQLLDPCKRPETCKHGGKCSVRDDKVFCDCNGTGYIGKNCHFGECYREQNFLRILRGS